MTITNGGINHLRSNLNSGTLDSYRVTLGKGTTEVLQTDTALSSAVAGTERLVTPEYYDAQVGWTHELEPNQYSGTTFSEVLVESYDETVPFVRHVFQGVSHTSTQKLRLRTGILITRGV